MKKIAVIGNSHAAMLKLAWNSMRSDVSSVDIKFFVWRTGGEKKLVLKSQEVQVPIDQIKILMHQDHVVDLDQFHAVVVCGLGYSLSSILEIYREHRTLEQKEGGYLISESCLREAVDGVIKQTDAMKVFEALTSLHCSKIYVVPTPRGAEYFLDESEGFNLYKLCVDNGDEASISKEFCRSYELFEKNGMKVLSQPSCTISKELFTKNAYSNASNKEENDAHVQLKGRRDLIHMNVEYGKLVVEDLLDELQVNHATA